MSVFNALRPEGSRDPYGVEQARAKLCASPMTGSRPIWATGPWAAGDTFTLADCAAAPSLFYADWVEEIGPAGPRLAAYRARLLAHPAVAAQSTKAAPTAPFFPLGAPDRD